MQQCTESLAWLQKFCPIKLPFVEPTSFSEWIPVVVLDERWNAKIKAAMKSCRAFRRETALQHVWEAKFEESLLARGVEFQTPEAAQTTDGWQCDQCHEVFKSKTALAMHAHKTHGYKSKARYFAGGETCQACLKMYHCRARLRAHLYNSDKCVQRMEGSMPPLSGEVIAANDEEDRQQCRQLKRDGWWAAKSFAPVVKTAGPLLPISGTTDANTMKQRLEARFGSGGNAFQELQGRSIAEDSDNAPPPWWKNDDWPSVVMQSPQGTESGDGQFAAEGLARLHARLHIRCFVAHSLFCNNPFL